MTGAVKITMRHMHIAAPFDARYTSLHTHIDDLRGTEMAEAHRNQSRPKHRNTSFLDLEGKNGHFKRLINNEGVFSTECLPRANKKRQNTLRAPLGETRKQCILQMKKLRPNPVRVKCRRNKERRSVKPLNNNGWTYAAVLPATRRPLQFF